MRVLREPTAEEKAEFEGLSHNPVVRKFFETSLETAKNVLINTSAEDEFRTVQGQAQALAHIVNAMQPGKR